MGKDLRGKELGVGISQRSDGFYVADILPNMEDANRNYSESYRSADSGWLIRNTRMNTVI